MPKKNMGNQDLRQDGITLACHDCGQELPLMQTYIMLENEDAHGNLICDHCYSSQNAG